MNKPIIGIDFDNTIVSYHDLFHTVALERRLIDVDFPKNKEKIRDYLRAINKENEWTQMQGIVYGSKMAAAKPFPGVIDFFRKIHESKIKIYIISHKTKYPYLGEKYDLHRAAAEWIKCANLNVTATFFLESQRSKLEKIRECRCTYFIDDLPEIFSHEFFPTNVGKILFSPEKKLPDCDTRVFSTWENIAHYLASLDYA